jgi:hypothetical protein
LRRQDAEANGEAGPKGEPLMRRVIQAACRNDKRRFG